MEELIYHIPPLPEGIRKVPHANQLFEKISFGKVREERISSRDCFKLWKIQFIVQVGNPIPGPNGISSSCKLQQGLQSIESLPVT